MPLKKSQKAIILISVAWGVISLLIAGGLAADSYTSHFSIVGFFAIFLICALPALLYWAGLWIWGWGYIRRAVRFLCRWPSLGKLGRNGTIRFLFRLQHFEKMNDSIQTAEEAKKIIYRTANFFLGFGVIGFIAFATDFANDKANSVSSFLTALFFLSLGWFLKYSNSRTAAIIMALLSILYFTVGFALIINFESTLMAVMGLLFALLGACIFNESLRSYFAIKKLRNKAFTASEIDEQLEAPAFGWKWNIGLLLFWLITPLGLAYAIYNFSAYGTGNELGSFLIISAITTVIVRAIQKKRKKVYRPLHILGALFLAGVIQFGIDYEKLVETQDAQTLQSELKNAPAEKYWEIVNASHTRMGKALKSGFEIGQEVTTKVTVVYDSVICSPATMKRFLDPRTLQSRAKRQQLMSELKPKFTNSVSANSKIDAIYNEAYKSFDGLKNISSSTKSVLLNGYKRSTEKVIPLEKAYMQSYGDLYKSLFDLYDYLDKTTGLYQMSNDGVLLFADQISLDQYNKLRDVLTNSADNIDAAQKRLDDKLVEIQNNGIKEMQSQQ